MWGQKPRRGTFETGLCFKNVGCAARKNLEATEPDRPCRAIDSSVGKRNTQQVA